MREYRFKNPTPPTVAIETHRPDGSATLYLVADDGSKVALVWDDFEDLDSTFVALQWLRQAADETVGGA